MGDIETASFRSGSDGATLQMARLHASADLRRVTRGEPPRGRGCDDFPPRWFSRCMRAR